MFITKYGYDCYKCSYGLSENFFAKKHVHYTYYGNLKAMLTNKGIDILTRCRIKFLLRHKLTNEQLCEIIDKDGKIGHLYDQHTMKIKGSKPKFKSAFSDIKITCK